MKYFDWSEEKNKILQANRGISFEEVLLALDNDQLLDIVKHHNKKNYAGQKIFIIEIREYVYLVLFVEDTQKVFLKTIIPSRKATKKYLQKSKHE